MVNYFDFIFVFVFLSSVYIGWHRGFLQGTSDLVQWLGSLWIGLRFYAYPAGWLSRAVDWSPVWIAPFALLMVTLLTGFLIRHIGMLVLKKLPPGVHVRKSNRALGLIPGILNGLVTAAFLDAFLLAMPLPDAIGVKAQESSLATRFASATNRLGPAPAPFFEQVTNRTLNRLRVIPESEKMVKLPFRVARPTPRPDLEAEMLQLINQERQAKGLEPLAADTVLVRVARLHAADMFRRGYFSHYTPEGKDPFDRIRKYKIGFLSAGENLALAPTLTIAHEGLMNSPGHRANILHKKFGRVGIGVMEGGFHRLMVTQNFRN
jgi:uncharacterized protein YkwD